MGCSPDARRKAPRCGGREPKLPRNRLQLLPRKSPSWPQSLAAANAAFETGLKGFECEKERQGVLKQNTSRSDDEAGEPFQTGPQGDAIASSRMLQVREKGSQCKGVCRPRRAGFECPRWVSAVHRPDHRPSRRRPKRPADFRQFLGDDPLTAP